MVVETGTTTGGGIATAAATEMEIGGVLIGVAGEVTRAGTLTEGTAGETTSEESQTGVTVAVMGAMAAPSGRLQQRPSQ